MNTFGMAKYDPDIERVEVELKDYLNTKDHQMKDSLYHTLFKLVTQGPQPVSNCVSVTGITEAANLGLVTVDPQGDVDWYRITSSGVQTLLDAYEKRPDPEEQIFGAVHVCFAEIVGGGKLDGTPLVVLGGALSWAKEYLIGSKLTFSTSFGAYDYATFDYLDLNGKTWLLKPGDWLILREDHNHIMHRYEVEDEE
jgi:hypothetical protein